MEWSGAEKKKKNLQETVVHVVMTYSCIAGKYEENSDNCLMNKPVCCACFCLSAYKDSNIRKLVACSVAEEHSHSRVSKNVRTCCNY